MAAAAAAAAVTNGGRQHERRRPRRRCNPMIQRVLLSSVVVVFLLALLASAVPRADAQGEQQRQEETIQQDQPTIAPPKEVQQLSAVEEPQQRFRNEQQLLLEQQLKQQQQGELKQHAAAAAKEQIIQPDGTIGEAERAGAVITDTAAAFGSGRIMDAAESKEEVLPFGSAIPVLVARANVAATNVAEATTMTDGNTTADSTKTTTTFGSETPIVTAAAAADPTTTKAQEESATVTTMTPPPSTTTASTAETNTTLTEGNQIPKDDDDASSSNTTTSTTKTSVMTNETLTESVSASADALVVKVLNDTVVVFEDDGESKTETTTNTTITPPTTTETETATETANTTKATNTSESSSFDSLIDDVNITNQYAVVSAATDGNTTTDGDDDAEKTEDAENETDESNISKTMNRTTAQLKEAAGQTLKTVKGLIASFDKESKRIRMKQAAQMSYLDKLHKTFLDKRQQFMERVEHSNIHQLQLLKTGLLEIQTIQSKRREASKTAPPVGITVEQLDEFIGPVEELLKESDETIATWLVNEMRQEASLCQSETRHNLTVLQETIIETAQEMAVNATKEEAKKVISALTNETAVLWELINNESAIMELVAADNSTAAFLSKKKQTASTAKNNRTCVIPAMAAQTVQDSLVRFTRDGTGRYDHAQHARVLYTQTSATYRPPPTMPHETLGWFNSWIPQDWETQLLPDGWEEWDVRIPDYVAHTFPALFANTGVNNGLDVPTAASSSALASTPVVGPEMVLHPLTLPGSCWPMEGRYGHFVIELAYPVKIEAISVEHTSKLLLPHPDDDLKSAPKEIKVYGYRPCSSSSTVCNKDGSRFDRSERILILTVQYDIAVGGIQTFEVGGTASASPLELEPDEDSIAQTNAGTCSATATGSCGAATSEVFAAVDFEVVDNWGHPEFTCLYRLRVHGDAKLG